MHDFSMLLHISSYFIVRVYWNFLFLFSTNFPWSIPANRIIWNLNFRMHRYWFLAGSIASPRSTFLSHIFTYMYLYMYIQSESNDFFFTNVTSMCSRNLPFLWKLLWLAHAQFELEFTVHVSMFTLFVCSKINSALYKRARKNKNKKYFRHLNFVRKILFLSVFISSFA